MGIGCSLRQYPTSMIILSTKSGWCWQKRTDHSWGAGTLGVKLMMRARPSQTLGGRSESTNIAGTSLNRGRMTVLAARSFCGRPRFSFSSVSISHLLSLFTLISFIREAIREGAKFGPNHKAVSWNRRANKYGPIIGRYSGPGCEQDP